MGVLITILIFVAVLGLLVLVHEFGHFIAARKSGIAVDEFGIGFPPRITGKQIGKTFYSINWIPVGGFVRIKGVAGDDDNAEAHAPDSDSFAAKPMWRRFVVLFAGIGMNVLLAVVLFAIVHMVGFTTSPVTLKNGAIVSGEQVIITGSVEGGPAETAGLEAGDQIISINDDAVLRTDDVSELTLESGVSLDFLVERDNERIAVPVVPTVVTLVEGEEYVGVGIGLEQLVDVRYSWYRSLWLGVTTTAEMTGLIFESLRDTIGAIGSGDPGATDQLAGPVGIAVITGEVARLGVVPLMQFAALLSINLALFNLFPLPALDGGRIAFLAAEAVRRKPVSPKFEAVVHNIGFMLLLFLVLLVTVKDIGQYI